LPDGPIDKTFDYLVPDRMAADVRVGTLVRVELHGRRVGGWVVADGVEPPPGVHLRPLAKVTGWGPAPDVVDLARWAAWRWAGRPAQLLRTASPPVAVRGLPPARPASADAQGHDDVVTDVLSRPRSVLRLAPAADRYPLVAAAAARGDALVLAPSVGVATQLADRLRRDGFPVALMPRDWAAAAAGGRVVVGARAAAWAPAPGLAVAVVLDAHDEVYQEERAPTWNAWTVVAERAARTGASCVLVTPMPTPDHLAWGPVITTSRAAERAGWAALDVVDRRHDDPRSGLFSDRLVAAIRSDSRVLCVLNRKGRARLLACGACGELARCETCGASMASDGDLLRCGRCHTTRPAVCAACGSTRLKVLRAGVSRVREELEALAGRPVGEVTSDSDEVPATAVVIGTEAVLHRAGPADVVAFLDFDQELLAPRYRSGEEALALLVRAARAVGARGGGGRVLVQTRAPRHEVLDAAVHADPSRWATVESERRAELRLPPATAMALVSGEAAAAFAVAVEALDGEGVEVQGPADGRYRVRAPHHAALCDALAAAQRPSGRLRIEVDPLRI
jgi:primosomal protein N' (replication factor Y)